MPIIHVITIEINALVKSENKHIKTYLEERGIKKLFFSQFLWNSIR